MPAERFARRCGRFRKARVVDTKALMGRLPRVSLVAVGRLFARDRVRPAVVNPSA
jgi:hypothetical protein